MPGGGPPLAFTRAIQSFTPSFARSALSVIAPLVNRCIKLWTSPVSFLTNAPSDRVRSAADASAAVSPWLPSPNVRQNARIDFVLTVSACANAVCFSGASCATLSNWPSVVLPI